MRYYNHGISSFWKGQLANPYPINTVKHREWQRGFNKAYFDNLEKVKRLERKQTEDD